VTAAVSAAETFYRKGTTKEFFLKNRNLVFCNKLGTMIELSLKTKTV
jgi:hypothetical protein